MTLEIILEHLRSKTQDEFSLWIQSLDDDTSLEVCRTLEKWAKDSELYKADPAFRVQVEKGVEAAEKFEDTLLQEKVTKLKNEVVMDGLLKDLDKKYTDLRTLLINEIAKNPDNAEGLRKVALGFIKIEIDHNSYDPENWKGVV